MAAKASLEKLQASRIDVFPTILDEVQRHGVEMDLKKVVHFRTSIYKKFDTTLPWLEKS
jgi:hypothetical protein